MKRKKLKKPDVRKGLIEKRNSIVRDLIGSFVELNEKIPTIENPNDSGTIEYLSNLYLKTFSLIKAITKYLVENKYSGIDNHIDECVIRSQNVVGILKEFHKLYNSEITLEYNEKCEEIVKDSFCSLKASMKDLMENKLWF